MLSSDTWLDIVCPKHMCYFLVMKYIYMYIYKWKIHTKTYHWFRIYNDQESLIPVSRTCSGRS